MKPIRRLDVALPLATLLYTAWALLATYPLLLHAHTHLATFGDPLLNTWIIEWNQHVFAHLGQLNLFDTNIFHPYQATLAYSENLVFTSFLFWPLQLFSHTPAQQYNAILIISYIYTALAARALVLELEPRATWGALLAGGIFAFAHYRMGQIERLQYITAYLLPLAPLFAHQLMAKQKWATAVYLALALGLQFWTNVYYFFYSLFALGLMAPFLLAKYRLNGRLILQTATATLIAILLVLPALQPYLQAGELLGERHISSQSGAWLASYTAVPPHNNLLSTWWPTAEQGGSYRFFPGFIPLILALYALTQRKQLGQSLRPWLWYALTLISIGGLFSLGVTLILAKSQDPLLNWMPYKLIYDTLPFINAMRVPARFVALLMLGLALLAGLGLEKWLAQWPPNRARIPALLLTALLIIEYLAIPQPLQGDGQLAHPPDVYHWLAAQPPQTIYLELPTTRTANITRDKLSIERLTRQQYFSTFHWQKTPMGYSGGIPPLFEPAVSYANRFPSRASLDFLRGLGVQYVLVHENQLTTAERNRIANLLPQPDILSQRLVGHTRIYQLAPSNPHNTLKLSATLETIGTAPYLRLALHPTAAPAIIHPNDELYEITLTDATSRTLTFPKLLPFVIPTHGRVTWIPLAHTQLQPPLTLTTLVDGQPHRLDVAPHPNDLRGQTITLDTPSQPLHHAYLPFGTRYTAGSFVPLTLSWDGLTPHQIGNGYIHLIDPHGTKLAQQDQPLYTWGNTWATQAFQLPLAWDLPPGRYTIRTGLYDANGQELAPAHTLATLQIDQPTSKIEPQIPLHGRLGSHITLSGLSWRGQPNPTQTWCAGQPLELTLHWQTNAPLPEPYTSFVHLTAADGFLITQSDHQPRGGTHPTTAWQTNEVILDNHTLHIPPQTAVGTYTLHTGMYHTQTQQNLPITNASGTHFDPPRLPLTTLNIISCP